MNIDLERRVARNQALFRKVNEAIERGLWPGEERSSVRFRCECAQLDCNTVVPISVEEYEEIRGHPRRFLLAEGHIEPEVEDVVAVGAAHIVVEKRGAAGAVAEATDPRG